LPGFQGISSPGTLAPVLAPVLFSHLRSDPGQVEVLEHLKIKTRLIDEKTPIFFSNFFLKEINSNKYQKK
jgi:hypothetical protein